MLTAETACPGSTSATMILALAEPVAGNDIANLQVLDC